MSCFLSNLWLDDLINLETLQHSFCDAANANGYVWLQGKLIDLDREKKRAYTSEGYIDYHYIVLAPGIDYNYASIGIKDPDDGNRLRAEVPGRVQAGLGAPFDQEPSSPTSRAAFS